MTSFSQQGQTPCLFDTPNLWIEGAATAQLQQVANLSGVVKTLGFPDLHPGRFGPVGMAALADRLYPQLIGGDIGCGMTVFKLDLPARKFKIDKALRRLSGFDTPMDEHEAKACLTDTELENHRDTLWQGCGSLGGGNHFWEIMKTVDNTSPVQDADLFLMVHTGSRGHGQAAWMRAKNGPSWNEGWSSDSEHAQRWLAEHNRLVLWAKLSRQAIAKRLAETLRCDVELVCCSPHNLVEQHDGLWLHRKGAAKRTTPFTPVAGSRDTETLWVARGENPALQSLPHGCGRKRDRGAQNARTRSGRKDRDAMSRNRFGGHVVCANKNALIEESGDAYKSPAQIEAAITAHKLGQVVARLQPLLTWKTEHST